MRPHQYLRFLCSARWFVGPVGGLSDFNIGHCDYYFIYKNNLKDPVFLFVQFFFHNRSVFLLSLNWSDIVCFDLLSQYLFLDFSATTWSGPIWRKVTNQNVNWEQRMVTFFVNWPIVLKYTDSRHQQSADLSWNLVDRFWLVLIFFKLASFE